jgi:hypothetical protein
MVLGLSSTMGVAGASGLGPSATTKPSPSTHITKAELFSPATLHAHTGTGTCSSTNYTILVINNSGKTQQLTEQHGTIAVGGPIAKKAQQPLCIGKGTLVLGLASNPSAQLTVTIK